MNIVDSHLRKKFALCNFELTPLRLIQNHYFLPFFLILASQTNIDDNFSLAATIEKSFEKTKTLNLTSKCLNHDRSIKY